MAVGQVNSDRFVDVLGFDGEVRVLLGDGTGVFHQTQTVAAAGHGALGDVGVGPESDLVIGQGLHLDVWTGDGTGNFIGPHPAPVVHPIDGHTLGRFGGDDHLDVLAASSGVAVFVSVGDGTLHMPQAAVVDLSENVRSVLAADLNGDGCDDAIAFDGNRAAPAPEGGLLRTLMGSCDGALVQHVTFVAAGAVAAATGDLDGDGVLDVAVAQTQLAGIALFRGLGDGGLEDPVSLPIEGEARAVALADLDADGSAEVVVLTPAEVLVMRGFATTE
jgi:hypothetical protein